MSAEWSVHFLAITDRHKTVLIAKDSVDRYVQEAESTVSGVTNPVKNGTTTQRETVRKALKDRLAAHGIDKRPTAYDKNVVCTMCDSCLTCNPILVVDVMPEHRTGVLAREVVGLDERVDVVVHLRVAAVELKLVRDGAPRRHQLVLGH
jgi:hypothetical protein